MGRRWRKVEKKRKKMVWLWNIQRNRRREGGEEEEEGLGLVSRKCEFMMKCEERKMWIDIYRVI